MRSIAGEPEPILVAKGLGKSFGGFKAVSNVDLSVSRGTIHALIGPNGAGKTTMFNLLTKFVTPSAGRILYEGEDITQDGPASIARKGIVRSFQISAIFPHLSVKENVRISMQHAIVSPLRFWSGQRASSALGPRVDAVLEEFGLAPVASGRAGELPYGSKRTLELATAVAADPKVLLLDEPTQGLGHEEVDRVTDLIRQAARGRTILMVEHNMRMVARIADRITVLRRGEKIAEGSYEQVSSDPEVIEAYLGSKARKLKGGRNAVSR